MEVHKLVFWIVGMMIWLRGLQTSQIAGLGLRSCKIGGAHGGPKPRPPTRFQAVAPAIELQRPEAKTPQPPKALKTLLDEGPQRSPIPRRNKPNLSFH